MAAAANTQLAKKRAVNQALNRLNMLLKTVYRQEKNWQKLKSIWSNKK